MSQVSSLKSRLYCWCTTQEPKGSHRVDVSRERGVDGLQAGWPHICMHVGVLTVRRFQLWEENGGDSCRP